ncbi:MAG: NarK/NasA family nitrate transporter [Deltaproteobacteria bacterium]|nr:NarK/NasA family nitrate transporter [Deltaproteobacteria bacterium]
MTHATQKIREQAIENKGRGRVLTFSTLDFTVAFAVWLMFGVLGIPIRKEFGLNDVQFGWLTAVAILNGSIWRLLFGILTDRIGGRWVTIMLLLGTAVPTYLIAYTHSFHELMIYAFLVGLGGNLFSVGIAWNSAWFPKQSQGFALGVFGAGNVGASITKFIGPVLIAIVPAAGLWGGRLPGGWRFVPVLYSVLLVLLAVLTWACTPSHDHKPGHGRSFFEMLRPLKYIRVWRFSLYYVVVFGAYVALSVWLPKYYVDVFGLKLQTAALLTASFIFPASLLRPLGGWLSDRFGARRIMYLVLGVMTVATFLLSAPNGHIVLYVSSRFAASGAHEVLPFIMPLWGFVSLVFLVGACMGIGKAAVYKYIPDYFPRDVGAVGGLVGMLGALGGFFLPPIFGYAYQGSWLPQSTFFVLFLVTLISFVWFHLTVIQMLKQATPQLKNDIETRPSELQAIKGPRPYKAVP